MIQMLRNSRFALPNSSSGTLLIAIGLAILILADWFPSLPVITAMAVLTLGATDATLARFHGTTVLRSVILLHTVTYATFYALFIGATLHAATAESTASLSGWILFDLAASTLPLVLSARRIVGELARSPELKR